MIYDIKTECTYLFHVEERKRVYLEMNEQHECQDLKNSKEEEGENHWKKVQTIERER